MPELTGVPILDTFIYITWGAMFAGGAVAAIVKVFGKKKDTNGTKPYGRREGDLADLNTRMTVVEREQEFAKERHDELKGEVQKNREEQREAHRETRETMSKIFDKVDDQNQAISGMARSLGELTSAVRRHGGGQE